METAYLLAFLTASRFGCRRRLHQHQGHRAQCAIFFFFLFSPITDSNGPLKNTFQLLVPGDSDAGSRSLGTNVPTPMPMGPAISLQPLICRGVPQRYLNLRGFSLFSLILKKQSSDFLRHCWDVADVNQREALLIIFPTHTSSRKTTTLANSTH